LLNDSGCARAFAQEQRPPTVVRASRARLAQLPYCRRHELRAKLRGAVSFNSGTVQDRTLTKPGCQRYTNELIRVFLRPYAHALMMQGPEAVFRVTTTCDRRFTQRIRNRVIFRWSVAASLRFNLLLLFRAEN
jgi:hypothetical protein